MPSTPYTDWADVRPMLLLLDDNGQPVQLRNSGGIILTSIIRPDISDIDTATGVAVSTLTPLTEWLDLDLWQHVLFGLANLDGSNNVTFLLETSEDKVHVDVSNYLYTVPAGAQASTELDNFMRRYWRLSAYSDAPGYPSVNVAWVVRGIPR